MSLDFATIKAIPLPQVLARYGVALRFSPEWGTAVCPLPSHKPNDRDKTFQISLSANYWKCWSTSCNDKAGCKGGDCINFVALKENISQYEAAKKLSQWFNLGDEKTAPQIEKRPGKQTLKDSKENTSPSGEVKGYMASIDIWFDETFKPIPGEEDEGYWARVRKATKGKLVESFNAGKNSR